MTIEWNTDLEAAGARELLLHLFEEAEWVVDADADIHPDGSMTDHTRHRIVIKDFVLDELVRMAGIHPRPSHMETAFDALNRAAIAERSAPIPEPYGGE